MNSGFPIKFLGILFFHAWSIMDPLLVTWSLTHLLECTRPPKSLVSASGDLLEGNAKQLRYTTDLNSKDASLEEHQLFFIGANAN